jgi:Na+-driven multidrug efflux pump
MSRLLDALLWLTVPSLAMSRRAEAQLDGRTQLRVSVVDSLTRVTLIAATLWMAATGNWGTALLFAGLLAALAVLRYLTAVWFTRSMKAPRR